MVREACVEDVPQMVALAERKRAEYERYSPKFWRRAADAAEKQAPFFAAQIGREDAVCLVSEQDGLIVGFVIGSIVKAPPVYEPGSPVCVIDDFTVANPDDWPAIGADLLARVRDLARSRGAELSVVVCGHLDEPKREMLRATGFSVASEWHVSP